MSKDFEQELQTMIKRLRKLVKKEQQHYENPNNTEYIKGYHQGRIHGMEYVSGCLQDIMEEYLND